jgi:tRNA A58 N-methylase Trm61
VGEDSARERTEQSRRTWSVATPGWERNAELVARTTEPVSAWVLDHVRLAPGDVVLELGAGPGDFGLRLATAVASSGRVISTDFVPAMVDVARRRAGERGLANMEFRVMDAQDVDLDDASVDAVVHRFGPMLLPDPERSAGHAHRVVRPGGRYATVVWGPTEANPMFPLFGRTLAKLGFLGGGPPAADTLDVAQPDVTRA